MKSFTLVAALLFAGVWAADIERRQDGDTTITGNNQGNSGGATVVVSNGSATSAAAAAQTTSSTAPATSSSTAGAMGMGPEATGFPLLAAGGVLAVAANALLFI